LIENKMLARQSSFLMGVSRFRDFFHWSFVIWPTAKHERK